jgi:hypothetical protein
MHSISRRARRGKPHSPFTLLFLKKSAAYLDLDVLRISFSLVLRHRPGHVGALFNLASIMHMCGYPVMALCFIEQVVI